MVQKRNLSKDKIIQVAFSLADEIGLNQVTFTKIAQKLDIKYPSLYNYFNNMGVLKIEMTVYLLNELNMKLMQRLIGKSGEDAIREFSYVYRNYALENKTAYSLFTNIPSTEDAEVHRLAKQTTDIIRQVLDFYIKDEPLIIHKSRFLRSLLHGFVSLTSHGYFQGQADLEDTFRLMIQDYISIVSRN